QADIPARYAVGYSVQERKGGEYIVRQRHAHAWCLAWLNGGWREVDTTPGSWSALGGQRASLLEPISDLWSRLWFAFSKWRWSQSQLRKYLLLAIAVLLLAGVAQLITYKKWRRARRRAPVAAVRNPALGTDSEFYLIEKRLARIGLERHPGETWFAWLRRVSEHGRIRANGLEPIVVLHYKLR